MGYRSAEEQEASMRKKYGNALVDEYKTLGGKFKSGNIFKYIAESNGKTFGDTVADMRKKKADMRTSYFDDKEEVDVGKTPRASLFGNQQSTFGN